MNEEHGVIVVGAGVAGLACAQNACSGRSPRRRPRALAHDRRPGPHRLGRRLRARPRLPGAADAYPEARGALDYGASSSGSSSAARSSARATAFAASPTRVATGPQPPRARRRPRLRQGRPRTRTPAARQRRRDDRRRGAPRAPASRARRSSGSSPRSFAASSSRSSSRRRAGSSTSSCTRSRTGLPRSRTAGWARSPSSSRKGSRSGGHGVATVGPGAVSLESGEQLRAEAVVVATAGLLDEPPHGWNGVSCVYYDAPQTPIPGAWLVLNGEGGPVNNLCVPSEVATGYAPAGRSLVSLTVLGAAEPDLDAVEHQLRGWFGSPVAGWRHLRTYRIPRALPAYPSAASRPSRCGSRPDCMPAATIASTRRSTAPSSRGGARRRQFSR